MPTATGTVANVTGDHHVGEVDGGLADERFERRRHHHAGGDKRRRVEQPLELHALQRARGPVAGAQRRDRARHRRQQHQQCRRPRPAGQARDAEGILDSSRRAARRLRRGCRLAHAKHALDSANGTPTAQNSQPIAFSGRPAGDDQSESSDT